MTKFKPRKLDKIRKALGAVDKAIVDRGDLNDHSKIQELESQMDEKLFDGITKIWENSHKKLEKRMNKTHKGLR